MEKGQNVGKAQQQKLLVLPAKHFQRIKSQAVSPAQLLPAPKSAPAKCFQRIKPRCVPKGLALAPTLVLDWQSS